MNADVLFKYFERIAEAPGTITGMRQLILDLAIRGKLVEQGENDEPAPELLKRIGVERLSLMKRGNIRNQPTIHTIGEHAAPFQIPENWTWVRLAEIVIKLTDGTHHSPPNFNEGDFRYVTAKNIKPDGVSLAEITYVSRNVHDEIFARCNPEKGDVLYIKDGVTTGVVTINNLDEPFSMLSSVALLKLPSDIYNRLLVYFLRSPFFYSQMRGFMKGAAITRVTLKRMAPALIPLPPLAEQHRIVAKVDELMAICDELEAAQVKREKRRDRLVASTLHGMNNGENGEDFRQSARFYFNHLPRLTTRLEDIQKLRQTILDLAVRGRLVPQDPNDEPVSILMSRLRANRAKTIEEHPPTLAEKEIPFEIPSHWQWVRVDEVADSRLGKMLDRAKNKGIPHRYLRNLNVRWFDFDLADISEMKFEPSELDEFSLRKGDVLICEGGEPGRAAIWDDRETDIYFQKALHRVRFSGAVVPMYFVRALYLDALSGRLSEFFTGVGIKHFTGRGLARYSFPLPPLAEQHRIVTKVDELMTLCDQLESYINESSSTRAKLLEAALYEALNGKT